MKKSGQAWSIDITIAIAIFMVGVAIFFVFNRVIPERELEKLNDKAESISNRLNFVSENQINPNSFGVVNYTDLKNELDVKEKFCIYFQDKDGNLVNVGGKYSVGDSDIEIAEGVECGQ